MKLIWLTDLHLDFLVKPQIDAFLASVGALEPDALLITGDISNAPLLRSHLTMLATSFSCSIYFLLGNHDFYSGSFASVDGIVSQLCSSYPNLIRLGCGEIIQLDAETALIGSRGWGDGRAGLGRHSTIQLNDQRLIKDFVQLGSNEQYQLLAKLGDESAEYLRVLAPKLIEARNLIVATHVPPFPESSLYAGKPTEPAYAPHFTNVAMGRALLEMADMNLETSMTVLCGHTHHGAYFRARPNLTVRVAPAEYRMPAVAGIITLPGCVFSSPENPA